MKAVIVAAGKGSRLGIRKPKGLLNIYSTTLIEWSLRALRYRFNKVIICVGYEKEQYSWASHHWPYTVEFVENPDYETTGSLYTLYCARDKLNDDILLLDSDILYDPWCLNKVIYDKHDNVILTSKSNGTGDDMYVHGDDFVEYMGKESPSPYTLVGISKIKHQTLEKLWKYCEKTFKKDKLDHHDPVFPKVDAFYNLYLEDLAYTEIDNDKQLAYALNVVYPKMSLLPPPPPPNTLYKITPAL